MKKKLFVIFIGLFLFLCQLALAQMDVPPKMQKNLEGQIAKLKEGKDVN